MDDLYVVARRVLLDALEALGPHRAATILVGAQAIYLQTGGADLAVAAYTTDADLALDPQLLDEIPPLEQALTQAGFLSMGSAGVGVWKTRARSADAGEVDVQVDLLVPRSVSPGRGRRAARLPGHDSNAARIVDGLEGALVDRKDIEVRSLEPELDPRCITAKVAGPGALVVAKVFKISERKGTQRANDKDALDVLRILQAIPALELSSCFQSILADPRSAEVGGRGLSLLEELFGNRGGDGAIMVARGTLGLVDEREVRLMCEVLTMELLDSPRAS